MSDCSTHAFDVALKSCPFCGGEPILNYNKKEVVCLVCETCGPFKDNEAEAIAAWNSRAERTCRIAEYADAPIPVCSECGAVQPDDFTVYYCWNCGTKVVGE